MVIIVIKPKGKRQGYSKILFQRVISDKKKKHQKGKWKEKDETFRLLITTINFLKKTFVTVENKKNKIFHDMQYRVLK